MDNVHAKGCVVCNSDTSGVASGNGTLCGNGWCHYFEFQALLAKADQNPLLRDKTCDERRRAIMYYMIRFHQGLTGEQQPVKPRLPSMRQ